MLYKPDWEKTKQKFIEYWSRENHDRPLISITGRRQDAKESVIKDPENVRDRWLDFEYVLKKARESFENTWFGGEAYPCFNPNLGPDIIGAMLGCDLEFGEYTSWSVHIVDNWQKFDHLKFDEENRWWKKIKRLTELAVQDAKGDYFVGITDLHAGMDALVSMRGPENLSTDLYDFPEEVKRANFQVLEVLKEAYDRLYNIAIQNLDGTSNWAGIWHPGRWYITSTDFICLISPKMFEEFVLPELELELDWLDASIFHLDGPGALKHLDRLLEIPRLKGIQWVYGAGQPTASHWIPMLQKIQDKGKLIQIDVKAGELGVMLEALRPEGVLYMVSNDRPGSGGAFTEEEARDIMKRAEASYKRKLY